MFDYDYKTTFFQDFSIADKCGVKAVRDTAARALHEWHDNVEYMGELVVVLNHKIWQHYERNPKLAEVYNSLWESYDEFCRRHFKGDDARRYFEITD